jgi:hypothetical protein
MSYILTMEKFVTLLVDTFRSQLTAIGGCPVDLSNWTQYFAFDNVGALAFGKFFEFLSHRSDHHGLMLYTSS